MTELDSPPSLKKAPAEKIEELVERIKRLENFRPYLGLIFTRLAQENGLEQDCLCDRERKILRLLGEKLTQLINFIGKDREAIREAIQKIVGDSGGKIEDYSAELGIATTKGQAFNFLLSETSAEWTIRRTLGELGDEEIEN
ncbi:MAG: hypothetical protein ABIH35_01880 [Patescibacteria group bacterium]